MSCSRERESTLFYIDHENRKIYADCKKWEVQEKSVTQRERENIKEKNTKRVVVLYTMQRKRERSFVPSFHRVRI